ncbi:hypothetical protein N7492_000988 [Penicillium capsulatum]|uniref:Uncharacterized protein n=1 Tax=Penicillium capsulatum TaxID=69766 RepID=A0A9W9ISZ1_9EURO|nr:hypothetical protein N7492_000988 [Penicillium capsulatum]KAJ6129952.1 hypothetical protein N7512_002732 [Penicillium capsulatum]
MCDAIGMRRSAYSYSTFWQNLSSVNQWREPVDIIVDSIFEYSALMEQVDQFMINGSRDRQANLRTGDQLLDSCLSLRDRLDFDFCEMQISLGMPWSSSHQSAYWSQLEHTITRDLFPDAIEYSSISCAEGHLLYYATLILLYPLMDQLLVFLNRPRNNATFSLWNVPRSWMETPHPAKSTSEMPENLLNMAEHYVDLICRSAKFLVPPETKAMGAQILLAPFSQATQFFRTQEASAKHYWCQAVFMLLPRLGLGIAPFLKDMIWPKYKAATGKKLSSTSPETSSDDSSPWYTD